MKTKPTSEERTITYYPEAVELKGTVYEGHRFSLEEAGREGGRRSS